IHWLTPTRSWSTCCDADGDDLFQFGHALTNLHALADARAYLKPAHEPCAFRSSLPHIAVRGKSRARRVQTVNCWRVDVFANRPDSTSSPHFGIESLAENAEIAEAGQKGWHEIVLD